MTSEEKMTAAPIQESSSVRRAEDEPAVAPSSPGDGESLAHMMGASATTTVATTEKVVTLEAETAAVVDAPEAIDATPSTAVEQTSSPAGMLGVVGAVVRPRSPSVVPQATAEEDEVVEIEHAAPEPRSVWILRKRGEEVVVVEEENTTREIKRLKSAVAGGTLGGLRGRTAAPTTPGAPAGDDVCSSAVDGVASVTSGASTIAAVSISKVTTFSVVAAVAVADAPIVCANDSPSPGLLGAAAGSSSVRRTLEDSWTGAGAIFSSEVMGLGVALRHIGFSVTR